MEGGSSFSKRKFPGDPEYAPASETYIGDVRSVSSSSFRRTSVDNASFSDASAPDASQDEVIEDVNPFDDSLSSQAIRDSENTPAIFAESENSTGREQRTAFEEEIAQFSSHLPQDLSIPAPYELAKLSEQEIQEYEYKYRLLDDALKAILKKYIPGLPLPSFQELEAASSRGGAKLPDFLRRKILSAYVHFLQKQTLSQILTHLTLFEAIAESIGNARHIREHGTGTE